MRKRRLTARIKREAAAKIAAYLRHMARKQNLTDPATWRAVAVRLGLRTHEFYYPGKGRGEYAATGGADNWQGVININTAYGETEQARAWIHELAHHIFNTWIPPQLSDAADVYCYEGDVADIRHKIARDVEGLVIGQ